ncbi:MAG: hypothetical protein ACJLS3_09775 [Erythrobacter sp.]
MKQGLWWRRGGRLLAAAIFAAAPVASEAGASRARISKLENQIQRIIAAEADLRAARDTMPECADGCLTPVEAVAVAFDAGAQQRTQARFVLDIRGGGVSRPEDDERLFFLNSERDYRVFGSLTLVFDPEAMRQLLNPARVELRDPIEEGDIIVERDRERNRVALNLSNMMKRFENRRLVVDGEVGLRWIRYYGTSGREGVRDEGYYQVWVRIAAPAQVTIIADDGPA